MRIVKTLVFTVPETSAGLRLDKALSLHEEIDSRSLASKLIAWDCVTKNNLVMKASYKVSALENFEIQLPAKEFEALTPYEHPLDILFEDEEIIIVDKPPGMVVHPAAGHYQDTLINALIYNNSKLSSGSEEFRPGLVHRLDKDTSGLLVIAKTDEAHRFLALQFKNKSVHRRYQALCFGVFHKSEDKIESLLARHPKDRKRFASVKDAAIDQDNISGKLAITHYKQLSTNSCGLSFVELRLETGRTHQIRVHLSEMGHAIVGDPVYAQKNRAKNLKGQKWQHMAQGVPRMMLHARELGFKHPNGEQVIFKKEWPGEELKILKELGFL